MKTYYQTSECKARLTARRQTPEHKTKHRLSNNLRARLRKAIRLGRKAGSAVRDLGCSINEFVIHIASLFAPGMEWSNYGKWHLDHIKPLAPFDLADRQQFLMACNWTNYQPLWAADNLIKGYAI